MLLLPVGCTTVFYEHIKRADLGKNPLINQEEGQRGVQVRVHRPQEFDDVIVSSWTTSTEPIEPKSQALPFLPPQFFKLLLGLAVHFPLPGVLRGALLLQELQQPLQTLCTRQAVTFVIRLRIHVTSFSNRRRRAVQTLRDEVGIEDEFIRDDEASRNKELVVGVVLDVIQRVDAGEVHWRQLL